MQHSAAVCGRTTTRRQNHSRAQQGEAGTPDHARAAGKPSHLHSKPTKPATTHLQNTPQTAAHLWTTSQCATAPKLGPWLTSCPAPEQPAAAPPAVAAPVSQLEGRLPPLPPLSARCRLHPASPHPRCCLPALMAWQPRCRGRPAAAGTRTGWRRCSWARQDSSAHACRPPTPLCSREGVRRNLVAQDEPNRQRKVTTSQARRAGGGRSASTMQAPACCTYAATVTNPCCHCMPHRPT